jgi:transcriptional repressor NrdR
MMKCPYCSSSETKVIDKRETEDLQVTRRRRECLKCEKRFTTYERVEMADVYVVKKDGRREKFSREKVLAGITRACEKRPVSHELIEEIVADIETKLRAMNSAEVKTSAIGELVMKKLKKIDGVAYIRFASVYREFKDISSFEKELESLSKK